jgi:cation diffusion facilitator family transporter
MHNNTINQIAHKHDFETFSKSNEKKTLNVIIITGLTMVVEIIAGSITGSMALLADGWHMATHAIALGITFFAYFMARRHVDSMKFSLGTGKFGILASYTSALFLAATAIYMVVESIKRFVSPIHIAFNEAILVACVGLVVNLISIFILQGKDYHIHKEQADQHHSHHHNNDHKKDLNLRAAYLHVITDAMTSVLAIIALVSGKFLGLVFLDPVMGLVGAALISRWSWGLLKTSAIILLDGSEDESVRKEIIEAIQSDKDSQVADLHILPLGSNGIAAIISVVSKELRTPAEYYTRLQHIANLVHLTIESHLCTDKECNCTQECS